jgi:hypothetical protein
VLAAGMTRSFTELRDLATAGGHPLPMSVVGKVAVPAGGGAS